MPECVWFVYGALLKQGTTLNPTTDSSRLLFSTWWIFITILTAFYTANLTAFLTLSKFTLPINNPSDIKQHKYQWITNKANGIKDYISVESAEVVPRNIKKLVDKIGNGSTAAEGDDMKIMTDYVTKRNMMFIREKSVVNHVMYNDYKEKTKRGIEEVKRCTFVVAKFPITTFPRAFAYTNGFKYKALFDTTIQYLVESGILQFKLRENLPDTEICPLNLGNTERRLRNSDLRLTYLIVAGGIVVAAFTFVIEVLLKLGWSKFKQRHRKVRKTTRKKQTSSVVLNNNHNIYNNNRYNNNNYFENVKRFTPPPPSYHTLFQPPYDKGNCQKKNINGREYWVIHNKSGLTELIPLRTPSALLFQFSN